MFQKLNKKEIPATLNESTRFFSICDHHLWIALLHLNILSLKEERSYYTSRVSHWYRDRVSDHKSIHPHRHKLWTQWIKMEISKRCQFVSFIWTVTRNCCWHGYRLEYRQIFDSFTQWRYKNRWLCKKWTPK